MKVLQTITTPTHRFEAGTDLPDDLELDGPVSREDWQRLGHLEAPPKAASRPRPAPAAAEAPAGDVAAS